MEAPAPPARAPEPVQEEVFELEAAAPAPQAAAKAAAPKAQEMELELEAAPAAPAPPKAAPPKAGGLAGIAQDLEDLDFGLEPIAPSPADRGTAPVELQQPVSEEDMIASQGKSHNELKEVFDEFRAELGELEEDEDVETHYNLGIAYREMDLVEEAISEFQKVAKMVQNGKTFRYAMQCYTLLGLCFNGRNEPKIAAMWYKKALGMPNLDHESVLALLYDLGACQQAAGDASAALDSFKQVYAMNIDYRDVAGRISDLSRKAGGR